ncbi:MAG TPA: nucleoside 2-deoxyribosyltransferase domain-containing protein [Cyclobacteriaceae bacterium]|jgi:nucleoside 2-deoxyribosyltransferase|nr:nucleoside 2-deoxyribosyltransferase domain-containing protein [Cyclobacteriaceae bacterium]
MTKVFLSGGTKGNWQDQVRLAIPECYYFDPREAGKLSTMKEIAELERYWLDECDILFFFFEATNPSGLGSAFEVGYCVSKGVPVIFVDEKRTSHSEWIGVHCNEVFLDLESGIISLKKYVKINNHET